MQKKAAISILLILMLGLFLAGCSDKTAPATTGTPTANPGTNPTPSETPPAATPLPKGSSTIDIIGGTYVPGSTTVKTGTTIQWTNKDAEPHTVSFTDEAILDKVLKNGDKATAKFDTPGTYKYRDKFGKASGVIVVE